MKSIKQNCSFKRSSYFTTYTWKAWKYVPQGILLIIDSPCISVLPFSKMEEIKLKPVGSMYN